MDNPFDLDDHARHEIRWHCYELADAKACTWSLIAANAEGFCYNYEFLVRFLRERNRTCGWGGDPNYFTPSPIPDSLEFLEILEFREQQLLRASSSPAAEWEWPTDWGHVHWNCPVVAGVWGRDGARRWDVPAPDLCEIRLIETSRAIRVHKRLMGHGCAITWGDGLIDQQVAALFKIFFESPLVAERGQGHLYEIRRALRAPPVLASWDAPDLSALNEASYDTCRVLGLYKPFAANSNGWKIGRVQTGAVWILERGIRRCTESKGIERGVLCRVVLAHELSHWLVHRFADAPGGEWQRGPYELTQPEVHETWAQLLALWTLTDLEDKLALAAFAELLKHQSSVYRGFERVVATTQDRDRILATLRVLHAQATAVSMGDWLAAL